jgi:hypothetical protein
MMNTNKNEMIKWENGKIKVSHRCKNKIKLFSSSWGITQIWKYIYKITLNELLKSKFTRQLKRYTLTGKTWKEGTNQSHYNLKY